MCSFFHTYIFLNERKKNYKDKLKRARATRDGHHPEEQTTFVPNNKLRVEQLSCLQSGAAVKVVVSSAQLLWKLLMDAK